MRIAILADPLDNQRAGIHVFTREMVAALIRNNPGHEILLIREKHDPHLEGANQIVIPNIHLPIGFASLRLFFIIPAILNLRKTDVVIEPAHFGPFNLLSKIKRVTIIHDLTPILFPKLHRWHSQILQKIFLKRILNKTDLIIANSDHTTKDICKTYPDNCYKVKRIYPGVSSAIKVEDSSYVFDKYKMKSRFFLFVGTIEPRKNIIALLEAFRIFNEMGHHEVTLVIAGGKGWKSESIYNALKKHPYRGNIICTGYVNDIDLASLYMNATALIYPSVYEGFGLPVIESLQYGTPVIASYNSSLPEAGGEAVLYYNTHDVVALAAHMLTVYSDPYYRKNNFETGLSQAKKFNWDDFANNFWQALANLHLRQD